MKAKAENQIEKRIEVRNTLERDIEAIIDMCKQIYAQSVPWSAEQLRSHLNVFPEGQFVAVDESGKVVGMTASLIIHWDDYHLDGTWRDFTAGGMFTNHDPRAGKTLYGAEVMVDPEQRSLGIGSRLYQARRVLVEQLGLRRIRAGARLRGYGRYSKNMTATAYAEAVVRGTLKDPTLSFQIKHGFRVLSVVSDYLRHDSESLGYAAVIEWLNPTTAMVFSGTDTSRNKNSRRTPSLCRVARS